MKCLLLRSACLISFVFLTNCTREVRFPPFDKTNAYSKVREQVKFGSRVPNSEAHRKCRAWFKTVFESHGAKVVMQDFKPKAFDGQILDVMNIIASHNHNAKHRIILAAHWDSRPFSDQDPDSLNRKTPVLGADDGASGVGILLEISRIIHENPLKNLGIDIILFDCEDYGQDGGQMESWCLGSQYWASHLHIAGYKADYGILLDMVGAKDATFCKDYYSLQFAPKVVEKVWRIANEEHLSNFFIEKNGEPIIDDHIFVNKDAQIPMIDVINRPLTSKTGFPYHWHTQKDNMDAIDPATLDAVGRVLVKLIYLEEAGKI